MSQANHVDDSTKRALAVKASVCPRTITKLLKGEPVRGLAGHRARQVLQDAGLLPVEKQHPEAA